MIFSARKKNAIGITSLVGIIALLLAFYYISTSLWFFQGLIETKSPNLLLATSNAQAIEEYTPLIHRHLLPQEATEATQFLSRYAIGVSGNQIVIAGLPRTRDQLRISESLSQRGWQVKRTGLYIYAENQSSQPIVKPQPTAGYRQAFTQIKNSNTPANPLVVAQLSKESLPYIEQPYAVVAYWKRGHLNIDTAFNSQEISAIEKGIPRIIDYERGLYIAIQSKVLPYLPEELIDLWEAQLASKLAFKNTSPSIIRDIVKDQTIINIVESSAAAPDDVQKENDRAQELAIAVEGKPEEAYARIENWLSAEAAYDTPVKQAFLLPDGTLGYEYVPEQTEDIVAHPARGCQSVVQHEKTLWICITNNRTTLTTNKDIIPARAEGDVSHEENTWSIILPVNFSSGDISTIMASGTQKNAHIEFIK